MEMALFCPTSWASHAFTGLDILPFCGYAFRNVRLNSNGSGWSNLVCRPVCIQPWLPDKLRAVITTARTGVFTIDMLEKHFKDIREFDKKEGSIKDFVLFFEPPS